MGVDDRHDVRARPVDFAVNEALQEQGSPPRVHGIAVEIEFHDVVGRDQRGRKRARHQEAIGVGGMAGADMAETVENAEIGEDTAAGHDVFDQGRIGAGDRTG